MLTMRNFSVEEQDALRDSCADSILNFAVKTEEIETLFHIYGYDVPVECWHNFRDSWFHYRKLYRQKDQTSMLNEKYALEEHLLRAWKDGLVYLLQEISYNLEFWYRAEELTDIDNSKAEFKKAIEEVYDVCKETKGNWLKKLLYDYPQFSKNKRCQLCCDYYLKYIFDSELKCFLQKIIHEMKDLILKIRFNGANIYRPLNYEEYFDALMVILQEINQELYEKDILFLVSSGTYVFSTIIR